MKSIVCSVAASQLLISFRVDGFTLCTEYDDNDNSLSSSAGGDGSEKKNPKRNESLKHPHTCTHFYITPKLSRNQLCNDNKQNTHPYPVWVRRNIFKICNNIAIWNYRCVHVASKNRSIYDINQNIKKFIINFTIKTLTMTHYNIE